MPEQAPIPGFVVGTVVKRDDDELTGRVKVRVAGLFQESPYWVYPAGWPGAGHPDFGSQYRAPALNTQVFVLFEGGVWMAPTSRAIYLTGYYGLENGVSAGPTIVRGADTVAKARERTVFWEDDTFQFYLVNDTDEKKAVLQTKVSGSKIELNAADGGSGKAETVKIEARTGISIYTYGSINIDAVCGIFVNGRKVGKGSGDI